MDRRRTRQVKVGNFLIGGDSPVSVQSMTKTHTHDADATLKQIEELAACGCEIVRCAVPNLRAVRAFPRICGGSPVPVIADIHFDYNLALRAIEAGAHGIRINPGNMRDEPGLRRVFKSARDTGVKVRIGVNSGSVRQRKGLSVVGGNAGEDMAALMVAEGLRCAELAESEGCGNIVLSFKASDVPTTMRAYRLAADKCDYPFHLGVTAAGPPDASLVKSAIGIGGLLAEGIGDTIRVSMTGPPHEEVEAAFRILEALKLRQTRGPEIISCPTCGRCDIDIRGLVSEVALRLRGCRRNIRVAIMGCVVNGPGEAAEADVGIAGGKGFGYVFRKGVKRARVPAAHLVDALIDEIERLD
jgi:(E)-4-hydroxy-3-methylbut-2-enyl-diphosphate synthase